MVAALGLNGPGSDVWLGAMIVANDSVFPGGRVVMRQVMIALMALAFWACPVQASGPLDDALTAMRAGDYPTAMRLLDPLARDGNTDAQYNLGLIYARGLGVPRDLETALTWYRRAADLGHAGAQFSIGAMYVTGLGVPQDYAQAIAWYTKAATLGDPGAQTNLALMYDRGRGVAQNIVTAADWYRKAAAQNYPLAQFYLGQMQEKGRGVPKDIALALQSYRAAADQGYAEAQYVLGQMYADGRGVPKNQMQAFVWFSLAAKHYGPTEDKERGYALTRRDTAAKTLNAAQRAAADKMVATWAPSVGAQKTP